MFCDSCISFILDYGHEFDSDICTTLFTQIPRIIDEGTLTALVLQIDSMNICPAHPDKRFIEMVSEQKGKLFNSSREVVAYLDRGHEVIYNNERTYETVRTSLCQLLTRKTRCDNCMHYRDTI